MPPTKASGRAHRDRTDVLHIWGSALTHISTYHVIVPGGGLSPDGRVDRCKPAFFLPCASSRACAAAAFSKASSRSNQGRPLASSAILAPLADKRVFDAALAQLRRYECGRLAKATIRRAESRVAYLAPLHPPVGDLQLAARRAR